MNRFNCSGHLKSLQNGEQVQFVHVLPGWWAENKLNPKQAGYDDCMMSASLTFSLLKNPLLATAAH